MIPTTEQSKRDEGERSKCGATQRQDEEMTFEVD